MAKVLNNATIGLAGAGELQRHMKLAGIEVTFDYAHQVRTAWWGRYAAAAALRDRLELAVASAAAQRQALQLIAPDGRALRFSPAEVAGATLPNGKIMGFTTIFSAIWRCIEGLVIDTAIEQLAPSSQIKLVTGMYDGLVYTAPEDMADDAAKAVRDALVWAMWRVGVPGRVKARPDRFWVKV